MKCGSEDRAVKCNGQAVSRAIKQQGIWDFERRFYEHIESLTDCTWERSNAGSRNSGQEAFSGGAEIRSFSPAS
ncbi:unnamed protein product [Rangifer tarandus platyrhynchus]|uniref:Uncharacterized protein n=2 Tax=Rangifer tarandus platyrhynchus TaxID=3082113 RepID=A0ABN8XZM1_RANTA|nr:unnamed protein product [Rangifer tarandus platyrhynchus]CAI9713250.1 unnamed protein product [Rangifer tarandus platyrhynchus]